jgi:hypothetical protein
MVEEIVKTKKYNGWSINANASGLLEVRNNSKEVFNASATNYFDNQWHHFALVVNRLTNTVYVDGNQQILQRTQTLGFTGLVGATFEGAMGWVDGTQNTQQTQRFVGAVRFAYVKGARTTFANKT